MRQIRLILMTAAALMLANAIPGYAAASQSVVTVKGSGAEEYSTLPSADTLKQDVGFAGLRRRWRGTSGLKAVPPRSPLTWIPREIRSTAGKA